MNLQFFDFLDSYWKYFLSPLFIGIIIFLLGKYCYLDEVLLSNKAKNNNQIKYKVIFYCYLLQDRIRKLEFFYNRLVYTTNHAQKNGNHLDIGVLSEEVNRISILLNESIPLTFSKIGGFIDCYFENEKVITRFNEVKKAIDKMNIYFLNLVSKKYFSLQSTDKIEGYKFIEIVKNIKSLVKEINISNTIFISN